ncbi:MULTISPECIES: hypothetical protein [unclassified Burkholderia]|nr:MULTISPECIES: hypothetical protein [unclassified Burkholderia]
MRPIAETGDEPRVGPMECNAVVRPPTGRDRLAAPLRGSAR